MDYLPLPKNVPHYITVPYEAPKENWYANEGFYSFPESQGWTEAQLRGGDALHLDAADDPNGFHSTEKTNQEIEQFFQTWLFFGLLIDVLKVGGVCVSTKDFLRPESGNKGHARIVDMARLPGYLTKWAAGIKKRNKLDHDWKTVDKITKAAAEVLDRFCDPTIKEEVSTSPLDASQPRTWPVRDEISTSMIALTATLREAALQVCDAGAKQDSDTAGVPFPLHARSRILTRRLLGKWCVADVTTTLKQLSIDGVYYLSASPGLDLAELDHHSGCIPARCLYEYDLKMYVTRHAIQTPEHRCREEIDYGGQLGPERGQRDWVDAIERIIEKGAVPIALWNKGMKKLWSVEWHSKGKRKPEYVAISHVWADGKGNPRGNSLPECQLDRIQRLVEKIAWSGRKPIPSNPHESDGIGFWMDTICLPVANKRLKDIAISSMRHVYSNAKAVLVLDEWLEAMDFTNAHPLDIITRVYQSNWIKRLWTHQEGFLPQALYFQFRDRCIEKYELKEALENYVTSLRKKGTYLGFPSFASMRLITQYTFLEYSFKSITDKKKKYILYKVLSPAMAERQTSRLADECICLATIVDIPLEDLLEIPSKPDAQAAQDRMEKFLLMLGRFDTGIIFNNYPRLEKRGFRWAPRSLLNFRKGSITYWAVDEAMRDAAFGPDRRGEQLGLKVHYRGLVIHFDDSIAPFGRAERGCVIECSLAVDSADECQAQGKWFTVQLPRDAGLDSRIQWSHRKYAVIIPEIPRKGVKVPAVVAAFESTTNIGVPPSCVVEHLSIATIWVHDRAPEGSCDIAGAYMWPKNSEWLIV